MDTFELYIHLVSSYQLGIVTEVQIEVRWEVHHFHNDTSMWLTEEQYQVMYYHLICCYWKYWSRYSRLHCKKEIMHVSQSIIVSWVSEWDNCFRGSLGTITAMHALVDASDRVKKTLRSRQIKGLKPGTLWGTEIKRWVQPFITSAMEATIVTWN